MRRTLLAITGWLFAAAVAALVGTLAVSLLGSGLASGKTHPLSPHAVDEALAHAQRSASPRPSAPTSAPLAPSTPATRTSTSARPAQATRVVTTPGGSIIARCQGHSVYLVSWTPRQGFESDDEIRGPARTAYLEFESDHLKVHVTIQCRRGAPHPQIATREDD